jgi:hypothetical protein
MTDDTKDAMEMLGAGYEPQEIIDPSDLRKYRIELPNLYDDSGLDVYEFRLLAHYKRVGNCTEGTKTTARKCEMSPSQVSDKRKNLHSKGFIVMERVSLKDNNFSYRITVVDKWKENFEKYSPHSHSEPPPSHGEHPLRTAKQRSNHIKKELNPPDWKKGDLVDGTLQLSQAPGMKKQVRFDGILSFLGESFHVNTETGRWKKFAQFVDERQQLHGEKLEVFVAWVKGQRGFDVQFWPPSKMMEMWPGAFVPSKPEEPRQETELAKFMREHNDR